MTEYVYRPKRRGKRSRLYYGRYALARGDKPRTVALGTPDKLVARKRLRDIIVEKQREAEGIISPKAHREAAGTPLAVLLAEHIADIRARKKTGKHARDTEYRITRILAETGWKRLADIRPDQFIRWRSKQTMAAKTLREYQAALVAFLSWLVRLRRVAFNPLGTVDVVDTRGKKVHESRAFATDELRRLLAVAPQRRLVYLTLLYTGQRKKEIKALVWDDLRLDGDRPHVRLRGYTLKDRENRSLPLHPMLAAELRAAKPADAKPGALVFGTMPKWDTLMSDLEKAGIAHADELGRVLHFHAFRKTFQTLGVLHGVNQRAAQDFLGHSDANLTANIYTEVPQDSYHDEIRKIPWIAAPDGVAAECAQISAKTPIPGAFLTLVRNFVTVAKTVDIKQIDAALASPKMVEVAGVEPACP
ncbi:tyrosine-type recombinase/integrase [Termitidicoccus mucosus]|uniref:site-specific integrase n=1 Tax=Termitidicoccus mucosus TaxID=1184151 RepID=UPI0026D7F4D7